ncbi:hypothetical protein ACVBEF_09230 [Glaciimonas sp. GG7]
MARIDDIVKRQKDGAKFIISGAMLGLEPEEFDTVAKLWIQECNHGFVVSGVPHRKCIDGEFFIDRITVTKVEST